MADSPKDRDAPELAGGSRPAAVARARALMTGGMWVGSYVLATAIVEETMRALGPGRSPRLRA